MKQNKLCKGCNKLARRPSKSGKYQRFCNTCGNRRRREIRRSMGLPGSSYTKAYKIKRRWYVKGKHCEMCNARKNLTIDHIKPLKYGGKLLRLANWRVLCEDHHRMVTEQMDKCGKWGESLVAHLKRLVPAYYAEVLWKIRGILRKNNFQGSEFLRKNFLGN